MAQQKQPVKKAAAAKQTGAVKSVAKRAAVKPQAPQKVAAEQRHQLVAEVAYLIAERRGFQGDMALNDWLQAEAEVDARFAARH